MKNLLLGFSLAANAALIYLVLQDKDKLSSLSSRIDNVTDQVSGKAQQVKGAITGDTSDKFKGNVEEGKGKAKDIVDDVKESFAD